MAKQKKPAIGSREEAVGVLGIICEKQRQAIQASLNYEKNWFVRCAKRLKETHSAWVARMRKEIGKMVDQIAEFAEVNRQSLVEDEEKKSLETVYGTIGWRKNPPSIELDESEAAIVARLEELGLNQFVRTTKTLNREALLEDRKKAESVSGIRVEEDEYFFIKSNVTEEIFTRMTRKSKTRKSAEKSKKD